MRRAVLLVAALALCACAARDLDRLKDLNAQGDLEAIAATRLECAGPDDPVCLQAREIVANACLRLGTAALAPGSGRAEEAAARFDCAVANYRAALGAAPRPLAEGDAARLYAGYLLSLRERRDQARSVGAAAPLNAALAAEAEAARRAAASSAVGFYYGASAAFAEAALRLGPPCPALARASDLLARSPAPDAQLAPAMAALARAVATERRRHACPA
ncbi:MAG: hypothetical protein RML45_00530 [Acetobacteraceae bacterium]|nr:hypothetical protein [Acetobacteraceae bacterium]